MSNAIVKPTTDRDAMAIIGASDDRELLSQGQDDFLPYDAEFDIAVDLIELKAKKLHDSQGVFVQLKVKESDNPEVKVNKTYTLAFFDKHKTLPEFVLGKMLQNRRELAACIEGVDCTQEYNASPTLLQLHKEIEPLGIPLRIKNVFKRTTRNGKAIHELEFARG